MALIHFDTDSPGDMQALMELHPPSNRFEYQRHTVYGEQSALDIGLRPVEDAIPDQLIPLDSLDEAIKHAQEMKSFPSYHLQSSWCPKGTRYNQNGLGYCWTWSGTGAFMTLRACEGLPTVALAPVSMGYLVGWANRGNYLESFVQGAREQGICQAIDGNINDTNRSSSFWRTRDAERQHFCLDEIWDTNNRAGDKTMLQQSASILIYGRPLYVAYIFWGHAVELVEWLWTPGTYLNVTAKIHNSHNEDDFILMSGTKCIPSEAIGFASSKPSAQ